MLDEVRPTRESLGESLHIRERLVVAPSWGRLRPGELRSGDVVEEGDAIGALREAGSDTPLVSHARARFVGWIAIPGRRVAPGTRLAVLRLID